jgi:anti-sigma28 factor (negative regulator of flagellin synthesis)
MIADRNDQNWTRAAVRPLGDAAPIDRAAIARLRRALADGSYRVNPDAVAAAMIAADLPLIAKRD